MAANLKHAPAKDDAPAAWAGFKGALWQKEVNVRAFIQLNYTPYDGDEKFLAPATKRTQGIWKKLTGLFVEERKKGVLDVSPIPSSIVAHGPGYIDKDHEVIVGVHQRDIAGSCAHASHVGHVHCLSPQFVAGSGVQGHGQTDVKLLQLCLFLFRRLAGQLA